MPASPDDHRTRELERTVAELQRLLAERQSDLVDLFDEAPIAYVHEGVDTKFIRANRTAMRTLGITPEQVEGTYGRDFVPDTPEAKQRLRDAFTKIEAGSAGEGVILELRRRDDGKPLWIQWWSRPHPSGAYTRTMFIDITERILAERERAALAAQNVYLREEIKSVHNFEEIVGSSPRLKDVLDAVTRVAPTEATVLITGETGTGKELIARAVHSRGKRRDKPLIKLNCAALPAGIIESELFGHERGAFSGAVAKRVGRFELADGGTIFLDEVGELAPDAQAKLLRVLQEGEFERVGGSATIRTDVRVIAATNRDLRTEAAAGRFRPDLFYRLNVFPIEVPRLRDRAEDIPLLTAFFVSRFAAAVGKRIESVEAATLERLKRYSWPGNVRELRSLIERAVILSDSPVLQIQEREIDPHAPAASPAGGPHPPVERADAGDRPIATLADAERAHIRATLERTGGVVAGPAGAAKLLGVAPSTLRSRMERLGIAPP